MVSEPINSPHHRLAKACFAIKLHATPQFFFFNCAFYFCRATCPNFTIVLKGFRIDAKNKPKPTKTINVFLKIN